MASEDTGCKSYYIFTPCCGGTPIRFCKNTPPSLVEGAIYQYNGPDILGYGGLLETGKCYTVTSVPEAASYPSIYAQVVANNFLRATQGCNDELCPECPKKVLVYLCCGGAPIEFAYDPAYPDNNTSNAYIYLGVSLVFGEGGVLYPNDCFRIEVVNTTQEIADSLPPGPPVAQLDLAGKSCGNYQAGVECRDTCNYFYQITNCADENETYCTTSNLSAYINNLIEDETLWPVIQVTQYPGKCFYVEQVVSCTGALPITPVPSLPTYIGCFECQQTLTVYYELINCNNPQEIIYTSVDLEAYVGHYITLADYGDDCFYVGVASGLVPSDIPVTPKDTYDTCEECSLPRYILEDCLGIADSIITQTDLSSYVGSVITLETCPDICWTVSETDITTPSSSVYFTAEFIDCPTCLVATLPVNCSTVTNIYEDQQSFPYLDFNGDPQGTETLQPGETSQKYCVLAWTGQNQGAITNYGTCVNGVCPAEPAKPRRKVRPGYNTPACTAEYYEKVECTFSEWMYKDVLEKRYGISNCCPADLMRWEIKHEMLMLDALINPDYTCVPPINCGCVQPSTCNCSCNSGN